MVTFETTVLNQNGEPVLVYYDKVLVKARGVSALDGIAGAGSDAPAARRRGDQATGGLGRGSDQDREPGEGDYARAMTPAVFARTNGGKKSIGDGFEKSRWPREFCSRLRAAPTCWWKATGPESWLAWASATKTYARSTATDLCQLDRIRADRSLRPTRRARCELHFARRRYRAQSAHYSWRPDCGSGGRIHASRHRNSAGPACAQSKRRRPAYRRFDVRRSEIAPHYSARMPGMKHRNEPTPASRSIERPLRVLQPLSMPRTVAGWQWARSNRNSGANFAIG